MTLRFNAIIFAIATLSGISIRTVMLLFTIDPVSGFIKQQYTLPAIILIVFLTVSALTIYIFSRFINQDNIGEGKTQTIGFSVASILMGIAIMHETFFSSLLDGAGELKTLHYVFSAAAAVSLVVLGGLKLLNKDCPVYLSLAPIAFWITRLIIIFSNFSTISTISDTLIETACLCLCLITFLNFSKLTCGYLSANKISSTFALSLLTSYTCFIASIPRFIADILSVGEAVHVNTIPAFSGLAAAIFCMLFAYSIIKRKKD